MIDLEQPRPAQEMRANLVYRMFTRIDAGEVPDAKTILKIARALGPDVIDQLHRQVIEVAKRAGVTHGRRFRIDTTVVETNVHYPTDSTLLQDGIRVLTRTHSPRAYERSVNGFADLR
jgi:IS5 family transposase